MGGYVGAFTSFNCDAPCELICAFCQIVDIAVTCASSVCVHGSQATQNMIDMQASNPQELQDVYRAIPARDSSGNQAVLEAIGRDCLEALLVLTRHFMHAASSINRLLEDRCRQDISCSLQELD